MQSALIRGIGIGFWKGYSFFFFFFFFFGGGGGGRWLL